MWPWAALTSVCNTSCWCSRYVMNIELFLYRCTAFSDPGNEHLYHKCDFISAKFRVLMSIFKYEFFKDPFGFNNGKVLKKSKRNGLHFL